MPGDLRGLLERETLHDRDLRFRYRFVGRCLGGARERRENPRAQLQSLDSTCPPNGASGQSKGQELLRIALRVFEGSIGATGAAQTLRA